MAFRRYLSLGRRLRASREAQQVQQPWVAMQLGVTQTSVGRYERGERRPSGERLEMYAAIVGVDLEELLVLAEYARPPGSG